MAEKGRPLTSADTKDMMALLRSMGHPDENDLLETNVEEAIDKARLALVHPMVPINLREAFETVDKFPEDDPFWKVIRAAKKFTEETGNIPHYGGISDFASSSSNFAELRRLYKEKCEQDWATIKAQNPDLNDKVIEKVKHVIWKCSGVLYPPIKDLINAKNELIYDDNTRRAAQTQLLFIAAREFYNHHNHYPTGDSVDEMMSIMKSLNAPEEELHSFVVDFCRFDGNLLPSVAATLGALAAQEITKIIVKKMHPVRGIVIYDAAHGIIVSP